jgi:hypothetical protein
VTPDPDLAHPMPSFFHQQAAGGGMRKAGKRVSSWVPFMPSLLKFNAPALPYVGIFPAIPEISLAKSSCKR